MHNWCCSGSFLAGCGCLVAGFGDVGQQGTGAPQRGAVVVGDGGSDKVRGISVCTQKTNSSGTHKYVTDSTQGNEWK